MPGGRDKPCLSGPQQVGGWEMSQIRMGNNTNHLRSLLHYLSLAVRSDIGLCTEGSGNVMCPVLPDRQLSEAGFVLANSITYFNMSGSGNRDGPEPYFTYLRGKDTGTLLPKSAMQCNNC